MHFLFAWCLDVVKSSVGVITHILILHASDFSFFLSKPFKRGSVFYGGVFHVRIIALHELNAAVADLEIREECYEQMDESCLL